MPLATTEQLKQIWDMTNKWFDNCPSKNIFADCFRQTRASVAEYIANTQFQATIYEFAAIKDK